MSEREEITNVPGVHIPALCCRCGCDVCQASVHEDYNGWVNRETWAVNLWLGNDQELSTEAWEIVAEGFEASRETCARVEVEWTKRNGINRGGEMLREWVTDELMSLDSDRLMDPALVVNMLRDIGSLWRVDWAAVAAAFVEDDE